MQIIRKPFISEICSLKKLYKIISNHISKKLGSFGPELKHIYYTFRRDCILKANYSPTLKHHLKHQENLGLNTFLPIYPSLLVQNKKSN